MVLDVGGGTKTPLVFGAFDCVTVPVTTPLVESHPGQPVVGLETGLPDAWRELAVVLLLLANRRQASTPFARRLPTCSRHASRRSRQFSRKPPVPCLSARKPGARSDW